MNLARAQGVRLQAELVLTGRNTLMRSTFEAAHFFEIRAEGRLRLLEGRLDAIAPVPDYVTVLIAA